MINAKEQTYYDFLINLSEELFFEMLREDDIERFDWIKNRYDLIESLIDMYEVLFDLEV